jgi:DNA-binding Lrp family transcriptional regulator
MIGLIMIKVSPALERSAYIDLQSRPEMIKIYRLFGEFSFLLVIQARERSHLDRLLQEIRVKNHVLTTGPLLISLDQELPWEAANPGLCRVSQS